jgi:hypothetical protein
MTTSSCEGKPLSTSIFQVLQLVEDLTGMKTVSFRLEAVFTILKLQAIKSPPMAGFDVSDFTPSFAR